MYNSTTEIDIFKPPSSTAMLESIDFDTTFLTGGFYLILKWFFEAIVKCIWNEVKPNIITRLKRFFKGQQAATDLMRRPKRFNANLIRNGSKLELDLMTPIRSLMSRCDEAISLSQSRLMKKRKIIPVKILWDQDFSSQEV